MAEEGLLRIAGAQEPAPDKYTSLAFLKFFGGLQTQRSPFQSIDTRYNSKFLGGKPDALIGGSNVEISNSLTLQRRPGLAAYGVSNIPSPTAFFSWQLATTADLILVVDTSTSGGDNNAGANGAVFNYSPTHSGIYINKAALSKQTNFIDVVNTLYMGNGVDLFKVIGPNLLSQSNTFGTGAGTNFSIQSPWTQANVFALTGGQTDPLGTSTATQLIWSVPGASAQIEQDVTPNYTPIASNTFTFSLWMKRTGGAISVNLQISDQNVSLINTQFALTTTWTKYQVTGTMTSTSNVIKVLLHTPTTTNTMVIYGAQLEVGGPATTTQVTTTKPQGVYLWGIQAPSSAPTAVASSSVIGNAWLPSHAYVTAIYALSQVATGTGVYTGVFANGAGNNLAGQTFTIAGFATPANNGAFACTASTATTITLSNANSVLEVTAATATPTVTITSVTAAGVYSGTIQGGGSNAFSGYAVTIKGFVNPSNNGTFFVNASTGVSLSVINPNAIAETVSATALILGQAITDSNGNLQVATASGTSGTTNPPWNISPGGTTTDGTQASFLVQTATGSVLTGTNSVAVAFPANVTASNSLIAYIALNGSGSASVTDTQGNLWTQITTATSGPFKIFMFWTKSAAAGATTVTATVTGAQGLWLGIQETAPLSAVDANNSNNAASIPAGPNTFQTGVVTTTTTADLVVSFTAIVAGSHATSTLTPPTALTPIVTGSGIVVSQGQFSTEAAYQYFTVTTVLNPIWSLTMAAGGGREMGITAAFKATNTVTLVWTNYGPLGLTALIGFQYYYAFMNSQTGHLSNVSPISTSTGPIAGLGVSVSGSGMQITPSGPYSQDPQVDKVVIFRNTDAGPFFYQLAIIANPGTTTSAGTWSYTDQIPSAQLNTSIFAPIGLLNSLPPAGLANMEYFAGRVWGSVNNFLYYNTAADNAALLNIKQNGVPPESWNPLNVIPFNAPITRILAVGGGLVVATTTDTWFVTGQNILSGGFNPKKALAKHGLRSYNAMDIDGSSVYLYTSDRQFLIINPSSGSVEYGYPIGDTLEDGFSPVTAYIARHVAGSRDNAIYLADGVSQWYRLNPNQQGASMSGEATPVWSPKADFSSSIGGISAIASIETSAGIVQLLVGLPPLSTSGVAQAGPVLVRSLTTFSDNTVAYQWTATVGSILLATPGKLAETESITTEFNNSGASLASQCTVSVLLDELSGTFESLPSFVNDPPQLRNSATVLSNRFYLSQGATPPICRHIQIKLSGQLNSGLPASTKDELIGLTVRGCLVNEQV